MKGPHVAQQGREEPKGRGPRCTNRGSQGHSEGSYDRREQERDEERGRHPSVFPWNRQADQ